MENDNAYYSYAYRSLKHHPLFANHGNLDGIAYPYTCVSSFEVYASKQHHRELPGTGISLPVTSESVRHEDITSPDYDSNEDYIKEHSAIKPKEPYTFAIPQRYDIITGLQIKIEIPYLQVYTGHTKCAIRWKEGLDNNIISKAVIYNKHKPLEEITKDTMNTYDKYIKKYVKMKLLNLEPPPSKPRRVYESNLKKISLRIPLRFSFTQKPINKCKVPGMPAVCMPYGGRYVTVDLTPLASLIEREDGKLVLPEDIVMNESIRMTMIVHGAFIDVELHDEIIKNNIFIAGRKIDVVRNPISSGGAICVPIRHWIPNVSLIDFIVLKSPIKIPNLHVGMQTGDYYEMEHYTTVYEDGIKKHVYLIDLRLCPIYIDCIQKRGYSGYGPFIHGYWNHEKYYRKCPISKTPWNEPVEITYSAIITYQCSDGGITHF